MVTRGTASAGFNARFIMLAMLPMGLGALGALVDERRALGLTTWRSSCRAAGLSLHSITVFTLELLPTAVIGALLGGLMVLSAGFQGRAPAARGALAAHAGCIVAMPAGLLLCASAWPWPLSLAAEAALTALAASFVWWITCIRKATYSRRAARGVLRIPHGTATAENFPVNNLWNPHDCN